MRLFAFTAMLFLAACDAQEPQNQPQAQTREYAPVSWLSLTGEEQPVEVFDGSLVIWNSDTDESGDPVFTPEAARQALFDSMAIKEMHAAIWTYYRANRAAAQDIQKSLAKLISQIGDAYRQVFQARRAEIDRHFSDQLEAVRNRSRSWLETEIGEDPGGEKKAQLCSAGLWHSAVGEIVHHGRFKSRPDLIPACHAEFERMGVWNSPECQSPADGDYLACVWKGLARTTVPVTGGDFSQAVADHIANGNLRTVVAGLNDQKVLLGDLGGFAPGLQIEREFAPKTLIRKGPWDFAQSLSPRKNATDTGIRVSYSDRLHTLGVLDGDAITMTRGFIDGYNRTADKQPHLYGSPLAEDLISSEDADQFVREKEAVDAQRLEMISAFSSLGVELLDRQQAAGAHLLANEATFTSLIKVIVRLHEVEGHIVVAFEPSSTSNSTYVGCYDLAAGRPAACPASAYEQTVKPEEDENEMTVHFDPTTGRLQLDVLANSPESLGFQIMPRNYIIHNIVDPDELRGKNLEFVLFPRRVEPLTPEEQAMLDSHHRDAAKSALTEAQVRGLEDRVKFANLETYEGEMSVSGPTDRELLGKVTLFRPEPSLF